MSPIRNSAAGAEAVGVVPAGVVAGVVCVALLPQPVTRSAMMSKTAKDVTSITLLSLFFIYPSRFLSMVQSLLYKKESANNSFGFKDT
jgi:hypothetical protein